MHDAIKQITAFDAPVLRNTIGLKPSLNVFDDLSDEAADWQAAEIASDFSSFFSVNELQYHAIEYVFDQRAWPTSRFCDGSFPVWYGSLELNTTFYETVYHWKTFLNDTPQLFAHSKEPISSMRTVFTVDCQALLVDFRKQTHILPTLISTSNYKDTQTLGLKLTKEGLPGLITLSARTHNGTNLAIFNKNALHAPTHQGDYLYQLNSGDLNEVEIFNDKHHKIITI